MKKILCGILLSILSAAAFATDYSYPTSQIGTQMHEFVQYGFSDNVTFTPTVSGGYSFNSTNDNYSYGCSTRYCTSKGTYHTVVTNEYLTDGVNSWLPTYGIIQAQLTAGVTYTFHIEGTGYGSGRTPGWGGWGLTVYKL